MHVIKTEYINQSGEIMKNWTKKQNHLSQKEKRIIKRSAILQNR